MKIRSNYWDNFKGILIFFVVLGHFLYAYRLNVPNSLASNIVTFIYLFHMPAFIYTTGYLSRSENCYKTKAYLKLFMCFIIFNSIMVLFDYLFLNGSLQVVVPKYSYWYLLSTIFWRLLIKPLSNIKGILPVSIIISLLVGFYPDINNTMSLVRTFAFFPFFILGYKYDLKELKDKLNTKKIFKIIFPVTLLIIGIIITFVVVKTNLTSSNYLYYSYKANKDLIIRIILLLIATLATFTLALNTSEKKLPLITKAGKYSLLIYLVHRPITILFNKVFKSVNYSNNYILYSLIGTIIVLIIFSNTKLNNSFNKFLNYLTENTKRAISIILIILLLLLVAKPVTIMTDKIFNKKEEPKQEEKVKTKETDLLSNTTKISYVGDLILLKDQVVKSYNEKTKEYEFDYMFSEAKKYLKESDYSIGVLEGPVADPKNGYSTSNYGDGIKIYQNYPESFLEAIKEAGIDYVTTANNHMLDMKEEGVYDTIKALKRQDLDYIGTYKSEKDKEKNSVQILNINGIKIAVLSYSISSNYYPSSYFFEENKYISSVIVNQNSPYYDEALQNVKNDFQKAKKQNPDLIMVMAHMGSQFIHTTNSMQKLWNQNFKLLGADIILGDHSHAVQPVEYDGETLIINSPGNFANSYIENDGDATAITEFYIDNKTKEIVGYSIVPMFTNEIEEGKFVATPIYDYLKNHENKLTTRIEEIQKLVTKVMINEEITVHNLQEKYYKINEEYVKKYESKKIKKENKKLSNLIKESKKIAFIGDSITDGTKNGKHPWYESLMLKYETKEIINISRGSLTLKDLLEESETDILNTKSDLYIISIGANDIRYRIESMCFMTKEEYIENIDKLVSLIKESNKDAKIVLIAPWIAFEKDFRTPLSEIEKTELYEEYSNELKKYAKENNYLYINPNKYILNQLKYKLKKDYLSDAIHPNYEKGIALYSDAVLYSN